MQLALRTASRHPSTDPQIECFMANPKCGLRFNPKLVKPRRERSLRTTEGMVGRWALSQPWPYRSWCRYWTLNRVETLRRRLASITLVKLWEVQWETLVPSLLPPQLAAQTFSAFTKLLLPEKFVLSRIFKATLKGMFNFPLPGPHIEPLSRQPTTWSWVPTLLAQLPPFLSGSQIEQGKFDYRVVQCVFLRQWGRLSAPLLCDTPFTFLLKWMVLVYIIFPRSSLPSSIITLQLPAFPLNLKAFRQI